MTYDNSPKAVMERIKKRLEEEHRKEDIICPYCNYIQDNETKYAFVTYWGEEPDRRCKCEHCSKAFLVDEQVTRHFECKKIEDSE